LSSECLTSGSERYFDLAGLKQVAPGIGDFDLQRAILVADIDALNDDLVSQPLLKRLCRRELRRRRQHIVVRVKHQIAQPTPELRPHHSLAGRGEEDLEDLGADIVVRRERRDLAELIDAEWKTYTGCVHDLFSLPGQLLCVPPRSLRLNSSQGNEPPQ